MAQATAKPAAATPAANEATPAFQPVIFGRKMAANRLYPDNAIIRVNPELIDAKGAILNPKRGKAATRFALYRDKMTVGDYVKACAAKGDKPGVATADIKFDLARNFIVLEK